MFYFGKKIDFKKILVVELIYYIYNFIDIFEVLR